MAFVHLDYGLPVIESIDDPVNGRVYVTPSGNRYPSITTVLSTLSRQQIQNWQKRVGLKEATSVSTKAARRGTSVHTIVEKYLKNEPFQPTIDFGIIKGLLEPIGTIHAQEVTLWSDFFQVAGRVDCIAEFAGELAVIDFKTSAKPKRKEWIESYFLQTTFYSLAWEERTGIPIKKIVILMANGDGTSASYVENPDDYRDNLQTVIDMFYNDVR